MHSTLKIEGIYRIGIIPAEWSVEQYKYWWCDERDSSGRSIRAARMRPREKARYYVAEFRNMILSNGLNQLGQYITATGTSPILSQYFAVGTGAISKVTAADTLLAGEFFRKIPTGASNIGNQADVQTIFLAGEAVGTWTNCGVFGVSATGTANSGVLISKTLYAFTKGSVSVTNDWIVVLQSN